MINWDKIDKKISVKKVIQPILYIILTLIICIYAIIIRKYIHKNIFAKQMIEIGQKNETAIFSVEKLYLCSSANGIDNSPEKNLKNLSLYQYTDIAIYINNYQEERGLTNKNTVKELYIDNISIEPEKEQGEQNLSYINLLKIGSKEQTPQIEPKERIDFNIIYTNDENEQADYSNPTFYTDCSNPITLRYINNLNKTHSVGEGTSIAFDGTLLKDAGVSIADINCKIKFKINLVNNDGEYYSCYMNFKIPLDDIYNGTTIKSATTSSSKYDFFTL